MPRERRRLRGAADASRGVDAGRRGAAPRRARRAARPTRSTASPPTRSPRRRSRGCWPPRAAAATCRCRSWSAPGATSTASRRTSPAGPRPGRGVLARPADPGRRAAPSPGLGPGGRPAARSRSGCRCTRSRSSVLPRPARWRCRSANRTGQPPPPTAGRGARRSSATPSRSTSTAGPAGGPVPSTIVDLTGDRPAAAARRRGLARGAARGRAVA